jgi:hypothetical protein
LCAVEQDPAQQNQQPIIGAKRSASTEDEKTAAT